MTDPQPQTLFARSDTFFGVCEAIGQDFGFNPNWLRVAFAVPLLYSPVLAIAAYMVIGVIVAASHFAFPRKVSNASTVAATAADSEAQTPAVLPEATEADYARAA